MGPVGGTGARARSPPVGSDEGLRDTSGDRSGPGDGLAAAGAPRRGTRGSGPWPRGVAAREARRRPNQLHLDRRDPAPRPGPWRDRGLALLAVAAPDAPPFDPEPVAAGRSLTRKGSVARFDHDLDVRGRDRDRSEQRSPALEPLDELLSFGLGQAVHR